jgi:hypothetical protein
VWVQKDAKAASMSAWATDRDHTGWRPCGTSINDCKAVEDSVFPASGGEPTKVLNTEGILYWAKFENNNMHMPKFFRLALDLPRDAVTFGVVCTVMEKDTKFRRAGRCNNIITFSKAYDIIEPITHYYRAQNSTQPFNPNFTSTKNSPTLTIRDGGKCEDQDGLIKGDLNMSLRCFYAYDTAVYSGPFVGTDVLTLVRLRKRT